MHAAFWLAKAFLFSSQARSGLKEAHRPSLDQDKSHQRGVLIYTYEWGNLQPDCSADRPVTGSREST
eukprot:227823-Pelagomonas_calceolata.AAC.1